MSVATTLFLTQGYSTTSVRQIAREAGVHHTLVNYHFGSKQGLFMAVMEVEFNPSAAVDAVLARAPRLTSHQIAEGLLAAVVGVWERQGQGVDLVNAFESRLLDAPMRAVMSDYIGTEIVTKLAAHIGGRDATARAAAVGSIISGVVFSRYLLRVEPTATMPADQLIARLAPSLALHLR